MTYPLTICNGYTVIEIGGKTFMLDTGVGFSLSATPNLRSVSIEEKNFSLAYKDTIDAQLKAATGQFLAGAIGTDVLYALGGVECDLVSGVVTFGVPSKKAGVVVPFEGRNDFHFHVRANGKNVLGFLDVGAPKPMIDDHFLLDMSRSEGKTVEPSFNGPLHTEQFGGELEFGGVTRTVSMLRSVPKMYRDYKSKVYFGVAIFAEKYYAIDLEKQEIRFQ